jgi:hypothetical protein
MRIRCLPVLLALALAGCGSAGEAVVEGSVTLDGRPIDGGYVTLFPADGKGTAASGSIVQGRYRVTGVAPGPKVVEVAATARIDFPKTTEELAKQAAAGKAGAPNPTGGDGLPPDVEGNNRTVNVRAGSQMVDLALTTPIHRGR